ncbi:MAG: hypothetical protein II875_07340 [Clostridia bacterium]|nr:hypothetical protein [Clostridia bacterium]
MDDYKPEPEGHLRRSQVNPPMTMNHAVHTARNTAASIYTHVRDEMLKKATVNMGEVFGSREKG